MRPGAAVVAAPGSGTASAPGAAAATSAAARTGGPAPASASAVPSSVAAWRCTPPAVHGVWWSSVTGHLHPQLPPVEQRAVHGVHCVLGVSLIEEPHEGEPAALLGVPVAGDVHISHAAVLLENSAQSLRGSSVSQVVHFQGGHTLNVWRCPSVAHFLRLQVTQQAT